MDLPVEALQEGAEDPEIAAAPDVVGQDIGYGLPFHRSSVSACDALPPVYHLRPHLSGIVCPGLRAIGSTAGRSSASAKATRAGYSVLVFTKQTGGRNLIALDASLSLDVIIAVLAIFGAVWRLDGKIMALRDELKRDHAELRSELRGEIVKLTRANAETRSELSRETVETRNELKHDIYRLQEKVDQVETKVENVRHHLETRIKDVETKVDDGNQRLARLEGRFEGRAEQLAEAGETDPVS